MPEQRERSRSRDAPLPPQQAPGLCLQMPVRWTVADVENLRDILLGFVQILSSLQDRVSELERRLPRDNAAASDQVPAPVTELPQPQSDGASAAPQSEQTLALPQELAAFPE